MDLASTFLNIIFREEHNFEKKTIEKAFFIVNEKLYDNLPYYQNMDELYALWDVSKEFEPFHIFNSNPSFTLLKWIFLKIEGEEKREFRMV